MLTIRHEQMQMLAHAKNEAFAASLLTLLESALPGLCRRKSAHELREIVQAGIASSAALGLFVEQEVGRYTVCTAQHGIGFASTQAWALAVVNDNLLSPGEKLRRLEQHPPG
jgi:hypothetical protein